MVLPTPHNNSFAQINPQTASMKRVLGNNSNKKTRVSKLVAKKTVKIVNNVILIFRP